jgi:hypothetical protein
VKFYKDSWDVKERLYVANKLLGTTNNSKIAVRFNYVESNIAKEKIVSKNGSDL